MLPLLRVALSLATFCAACVLALYALALIRIERERTWPDLDGPTFELVAGAQGSWTIDWPARRSMLPASELHLVVDPVVHPGAVDVTVLAEPHDAHGTSHALESIGLMSDWIWRNVGVLPAQTSLPLLLDPRSNPRIERVSWVVTRVGSTAVGARAHLALRGEAGRSGKLVGTALVYTWMLVPFAMLFAAIAVRCGVVIHRRSTAARSALSSVSSRPNRVTVQAIARTTLGTIGSIIALVAVQAVIVAMGMFACHGVGDRSHSELKSYGNSQGPLFTLTTGSTGRWERDPDTRDFEGNELLWLGTDFQRRIPGAREIEVLVRVEPPDAAWSFDPGPRSESGEWRLMPRDDEGRALVIDPRRIRLVTWRVGAMEDQWKGTMAWLETCGGCDRRRATDGDVP